MRRSDIEAMGELVGEAAAAGGGVVKAMHEGIASRPFDVLGPSAAPVRAVHDGISQAVYGGVRGGLKVLSKAAATAVAHRRADDAPALADRPGASMALGAVNGLYGDHLVDGGHGLAVAMEVRRRGARVALTPEAIAAAYPDATPRLAVFVHGLFGDEENWRVFPRSARDSGRPTYAQRLQDDLGFTPVMLRYNTGRHVSANGRELAGMLEELVAGWPGEVEEIVLVGHSMGGLVLRSACHYGAQDDRIWTSAVRHVFSLGTPHLGADLEKGVHLLSRALGRLPETRGLATFLDTRSVGIKDLRFGACVDEDWSSGEDPDEPLRDPCTDVPFLPGAHYYFVGCTLKEGPVGAVLGDLLVRSPSASGRGDGRGRRIAFEVDNGHELHGLTHMHLLNDPAVYEQLHRWISRTPAG